MNPREFAEEFYRRDRRSRAVLEEQGYNTHMAVQKELTAWMRNHLDPVGEVADFTGLSAAEAAWLMFRLIVLDHAPDWDTVSTEVLFLTPELNAEHFESSDEAWCVCFEAGPHDWAIPVSHGSTAFMFETPTRGIMDVYMQPYYGFSLEFFDE